MVAVRAIRLMVELGVRIRIKIRIRVKVRKFSIRVRSRFSVRARARDRVRIRVTVTVRVRVLVATVPLLCYLTTFIWSSSSSSHIFAASRQGSVKADGHITKRGHSLRKSAAVAKPWIVLPKPISSPIMHLPLHNIAKRTPSAWNGNNLFLNSIGSDSSTSGLLLFCWPFIRTILPCSSLPGLFKSLMTAS